jgi:hypothetical protein
MTPAKSPKRGPVHEVRLIARIEGLLTNLEACHSAGLPLPAEDVRLAATLIRLYAAAQEGDYDTWLDREHARHIARLFKSERFLGSALLLQQTKRRLKNPTAKELLARFGPQPLETSLYDLLATFQEAYDKAVAERKRRPPQLHDPV